MRLFVPASVAAAIVAADSASDLCLERPDLPKCGASCYNPARAACCGSQVYLYYQWNPATNATGEQQCCTNRHNASYVAFSCNGTASGNRTVANATREETIVAPTTLPVVDDSYNSASGSDFDDELGSWDSDVGDDGEDEDEPIIAGVNAHNDDDATHGSNSTTAHNSSSTTPTMHPGTHTHSTPLPTTSNSSSSSHDNGHDDAEVGDGEDDVDSDIDATEDADTEDVGADADAADGEDSDIDADTDNSRVATDAPRSPEPTTHSTGNHSTPEPTAHSSGNHSTPEPTAHISGNHSTPEPTAHSIGNHSTRDEPQLLNTSVEHEKQTHVPGAALTHSNSTTNNSTHNATRTNRTGSNVSDESTIQRPSSATGTVQHCAGLLAVLCIVGSMLV
ncbi:hypothetical protein SPRG_00626 [Saprolegnia parasitica CBS 223.65]|uniref:Uncharacterized protein n=1 Tax=Saprolegnia parasitica (strain CBS 223.65) TaxID=695850 RepID=A0A067CVM1_SAPPC|nr:hypothetical protein SPRG_00626 [Saprolegnia parasitica CBS 223.65]KDO34563.1 hypothetical protein SPRG_00626 [Saprolegnia parasitica CBS 223.65]|eukprot:XP_012194240.1 hypothetical protein SPRG_00626 [Saprolegnia parasitica CBS 223.65]